MVATTTTKESTSTGGADTLGEPKESSESVSEHDSTSKSSDGDCPGKRVTFGASVAAGSLHSGVSGIQLLMGKSQIWWSQCSN